MGGTSRRKTSARICAPAYLITMTTSTTPTASPQPGDVPRLAPFAKCFEKMPTVPPELMAQMRMDAASGDPYYVPNRMREQGYWLHRRWVGA